MGRAKLTKRKNLTLVLFVIAAFFVFLLYLFVKSFPAEYNLYLRFLERVQVDDPFWTSFWFASELVGEVGLIERFAGSCFAVIFAVLLVKNRQIAFSYLRKAVLFEGAYYLFILPFIVSLFARPSTSIVNLEAGLSYALQIVLVSPVFFVLYTKMKKSSLDLTEISRWGALSIVGFTFALWVKHFLLNLYALPINLEDPVLLVGFLNSALTMLLAGVFLLVAFLPVIQRKQLGFNFRVAGVAFLLIGVYFLVYIAVSLVNQGYLSFLGLTEWWAVSFLVMGVGFLARQADLKSK